MARKSKRKKTSFPGPATRPNPEIERKLAAALQSQQEGKRDHAERLYREILAVNPRYFDALQMLGLLYLQSGSTVRAEKLLRQALHIKEDFPILSNYGLVLAILGRHEEALAYFDRALHLNPGHAEALVNRGDVLRELHRLQEALESYDRALDLNPSFTKVLNNRGNILKRLRRFKEALASYDRALQIKPDYVKALYNRGSLLKDLRRFEEAAADFHSTLALDAGHAHAFSLMAECLRQLCDWTNYEALRRILQDRVRHGNLVVYPFVYLAWSDEPAEHCRCGETYIRDKLGTGIAPYTHQPSPDGPIRIAYLSADFHQHATAYLMAELFELHDRERFQLLGVSFGPDDQSPERQRLVQAFDEFLDVWTLDDKAVADLLVKKGVHIAVDLKGYTTDCRPGIMARRPAPIQVNYLGYPGTMGAEFMDYILVDPFVAPMDQQPFYSEKLVQLPDCYQVNDRKRKIAEATPARAECGLPEKGFVFCSFNNSYKLTPFMFEIWLKLLDQVPGSVLWLLRDNEPMVVNLRKEAEQRGVAPERLVFAPRCPLPEHLARQRLADLFLDTLPVNAHTTASDALWAGLPVLTCPGKSFQARVAGSLLHAIGLPELVTNNLEEYEALALALAREPQRLHAIKEKLERQRDTMPLFDTERFCRHLESAYETMVQRWRKGEHPQAFVVGAPAPTPLTEKAQ